MTELILAIFRSNALIVRAGNTLLSDFGITGARWQVLGAIKETPKTVAHIARYYELSRQLVLWHVQGLIKDGIVELAKNPEHRRAKLVTLTEQGQRLYAQIEQRQSRWANELGNSFHLEDVRLAAECVRRLGNLVKETEDDFL